MYTKTLEEIRTIEDVELRQIESFLYFEAELLDDWKLMEWTELFSEQGLYLVPTMNNASEDYRNTLYIIADPYFRIKERAARLLKKETHIEYPHSRTRHLVTNIRIKERNNDYLTIHANFIVTRTKRGVLDTYVGQYKYKVAVENSCLKILEKRVLLDLDYLRPHGKVSIIL